MMAKLPEFPPKLPPDEIVAGTVDWSVISDGIPDGVECKCGTIFLSYTKFVGILSRVISKDPCPKCGTRSSFWRVTSPKEKG